MVGNAFLRINTNYQIWKKQKQVYWIYCLMTKHYNSRAEKKADFRKCQQPSRKTYFA